MSYSLKEYVDGIKCRVSRTVGLPMAVRVRNSRRTVKFDYHDPDGSERSIEMTRGLMLSTTRTYMLTILTKNVHHE